MSSAIPSVTTDSRRHFLQALRRVLRPIVRLMIWAGVRYDEFADVARGAYVDSAIRNADSRGSPPTRDEIAWMTGIGRARVDHYIESNEAVAAMDPVPTRVLAEVLHKWHTDPQFLGPSGTPIELEVSAQVGPSFQNLVAQIDADSNPEAILEKLLRAKSVARAGDDRLRAVSRCFIWPQDVIFSIEYWGATLAHMIETHEYNLSSFNAEKKRLERSVFADRGLPDQLLPDFHAFTRECADELLSDLDDWLGQHANVGANQADPTAEIGLNVFFFLEPPSDLTPVPTLVQPRRKLECPDSGQD